MTHNGPKLTPVRTGFDLHEGSAILAARRAERERCEAVAEAMIRRLRIKRLARQALDIIDGRRVA